MFDYLTKAQARSIFYIGSGVFVVLFVSLTLHSHYYIVTQSTDHAGLTEGVKRGKHVWERNACINCHTILGEGAYFAPELGNVWIRYGGPGNPEGARAALKAWIRAMPTGVKGRRQMPQFNLSEQELDDLIDFFEWVSRIDTQNWPPHPAG